MHYNMNDEELNKVILLKDKMRSHSFIDMSHEILCHILQFLPLHEVLSLSMLCKKLFTAVSMYLRLCKSIDFCEGKMYAYMPSSITDDHMHALFLKCPNIEYVYGLHPRKVERRRLRGRSALTVPGIIEALSLCSNLRAVEISDLRLLEAIMQHLPQIEIIGNFANRDGMFPPHASHRLKLQPYPRIFSLHLVGVEVPELTAMPRLEHLQLQCIRFTKLQPFRGFVAPHLKSFIMKHCMGPSMSLRYLSLIIALSSAPTLTRLELVRVPLPGGLFQRAIEDSYRLNGFVNLKHLVISGCKGVLESDLGHLMIVSSKNLETISIQPSLTRDSLFVSLSFAQCEFPKLKSLHLGFVDKLNVSGEWSNDTLLALGLAEIPDTPSSLTDSGMKIILELFPKLRSLSVSNCPHLMAMDQWYNSLGDPALQELTDLTLQHCHCIQLPSFALFLAFLPRVQVVILNDMFREPPKGCSHVGLSAGTGLGMSSAVVSNQDEHVAVNGNQQEFDAQADDRFENDDMDLDDVENGRNQEHHLMVLPQEFFDEQNNAANVPMEQAEQGRNVDSDEADSLDLNCSDVESEEDTNDSQALECPEIIKDDSPSFSLDESDSDNLSVPIKEIRFQEQNAKTSTKMGNNRVKKGPTSRSCASAFDPSQPSTSKSGNCFCACNCSDLETDSSSAVGVTDKTHDKFNSKSTSLKTKSSLGCDNHQSKRSPPPSPKRSKKRSCSNSKTSLGNCKEETEFSVSEDNKCAKIEKSKKRKKFKNTDVCEDCKSKSTSQKNKFKKTSKDKDSHTEEGIDCNNCASQIEFEGDTSVGTADSNIHSSSNLECARSSSHKVSKLKKGLPVKKNPKVGKRNKSTKSLKDLNKNSAEEPYNFVSEGTQATSADIRRSHKKQKESPPKRRSQRRTTNQNNPASNSVSAREEHRKPANKSDFNLQNKATSTSDPLMEDDAVQILRLVSESLISLTVVSCGISDIIVDHCHNLTHLEAQACRILKRLQLLHCPNLQRLNIAQCPKLELDTIVVQVICNISYVNILVSYEPCFKAYYPGVSEKIIFQRAAVNQSVILVHDYSGEQAAFKENINAWMGIVQKMRTSSLTAKSDSVKKKKKWEPKLKYPWGHQMRRIHGLIPSSDEGGSEKDKYQILTNDRLFAAAIEVMPWEKGIPSPCSTLEWESELSPMTNQHLSGKFLKRSIAFYIPIGD